MIYLRKAILIIHGFASGTYDMEELANNLEFCHNFDVFTFTLPGHDKITLNGVNKELWLECAEKHVEMLIKQGYKKIYIIGHSMGGVIACHLAAKYKEIKKIVLAAPAFHYLIFKEDKFQLIDSIKEIPKILKDYDNSDIVTRIVKVPLPITTEFMNLVKENYQTPENIKIPILILYGKNDKIVPNSSVEYVYNKVSSKVKFLVYLDNCTHEIYRGPRKDIAIKITRDFLKNSYPPDYQKIIEK